MKTYASFLLLVFPQLLVAHINLTSPTAGVSGCDATIGTAAVLAESSIPIWSAFHVCLVLTNTDPLLPCPSPKQSNLTVSLKGPTGNYTTIVVTEMRHNKKKMQNCTVITVTKMFEALEVTLLNITLTMKASLNVAGWKTLGSDSSPGMGLGFTFTVQAHITVFNQAGALTPSADDLSTYALYTLVATFNNSVAYSSIALPNNDWRWSVRDFKNNYLTSSWECLDVCPIDFVTKTRGGKLTTNNGLIFCRL